MMSDRKPSITVIGDSTIDNKIWVGLGLIKNVLRTKAHIKRADSDTRIASSQRRFFKYELSVVEHLKRSLPAFEVHDHTNDGFTTSDCLNGAYRDKVFGAGTLDLFPHQPFIPLVDGKDDIANSEHIIISVGGNNVREFLHAAIKIGNEAARKDYIKTNFPKVREKLKQEYIELVGRVRAINPHAKIIFNDTVLPFFHAVRL